jgi:hypothetical protein
MTTIGQFVGWGSGRLNALPAVVERVKTISSDVDGETLRRAL